MRLLAIDTAAESCAACVLDNGSEVGRAVEPMRTGHAERLMAVIDAALRSGGTRLEAVDALVVSIGPGSFTGIRVGVAAARGLALALKIPAVGISTLEALGAETSEAFPKRPVMVALDGGRGAVHAAVFGPAGEAVRSPASLDLDEARKWIDELTPVLVGNAAPRLTEIEAKQELTVASNAATADIVSFARLGAARLAKEGKGEKPSPLYLRAPDAKPQRPALQREDV